MLNSNLSRGMHAPPKPSCYLRKWFPKKEFLHIDLRRELYYEDFFAKTAQQTGHCSIFDDD